MKVTKALLESSAVLERAWSAMGVCANVFLSSEFESGARWEPTAFAGTNCFETTRSQLLAVGESRFAKLSLSCFLMDFVRDF